MLVRLSMPTSPDTLLRLVRRAPLPAAKTPRVLGVDDWALRKGRTYGSILVDLEAHRVVDLLPDRSAPTLAAWLRRHPGVKVLTRDRSAEYARAAAEGAPKARQVADRWHLLLNARQMLERWLTGAHARLRALPSASSTHAPAKRRTRSFPRTRSEVAASRDSRARRLAAYTEVRRRHRAGQSLLAISRTLKLARGTVRKYASAATFPERAVRTPAPSLLDPYLEYLAARHAEGCENALALWREIRAQGYPGTSRQVLRWLQTRRVTPARSAPRAYRSSSFRHKEARPDALPSPKQLAWLCVQPPSRLSVPDRATLARIAQDEEAAHVIALARRFNEIVRHRSLTHGAKPTQSCKPFEVWLRQAKACGVRVVETFAAGLEQDGDAVRAALTLPWSNAQSEGQVTRLKFLKRQMYGRASFELLRRRVLLAA
jgi:transposase